MFEKGAIFNLGEGSIAAEIYRTILPEKLLKDKEIQEIILEEEMQPPLKR